jgi:ferritin-like protein
MAESSTQLHEPADLLRPETIDRHRALVSLIEELDAVDWYQQRIEATGDAELAALLAHNRDEEHEHAAMTLEWLRRKDPNLDTMLRRYLFRDEPILEIEELEESGPGEQSAAEPACDGSLGIGSLRSI